MSGTCFPALGGAHAELGSRDPGGHGYGEAREFPPSRRCAGSNDLGAGFGAIAAEILLRPLNLGAGAIAQERKLVIVHAEGPRRYSARDVAAALSELLGQPIEAEAVPRAQWQERLQGAMSASLASLLVKANDAQNEGCSVDVEPCVGELRYGRTELGDAVREMLSNSRVD